MRFQARELPSRRRSSRRAQRNRPRAPVSAVRWPRPEAAVAGRRLCEPPPTRRRQIEDKRRRVPAPAHKARDQFGRPRAAPSPGLAPRPWLARFASCRRPASRSTRRDRKSRTCAPKRRSSTTPRPAGAVRVERAERAIDRQHHQGDDGARRLRERCSTSRTPVTVQRADVCARLHHLPAARLPVTAEDLLNLLLVGSDNAAARALARVSPYGSDGFVDRMNEKAQELGPHRHALRGSVGAARRQRLVRLRHGAAHRLRRRRRAHRRRHAQDVLQRPPPASARSPPTAPTSW